MAAIGDGAEWNIFHFTSPGKKENLKGKWNHTLSKESPGAYQSSQSYSGKPFLLNEGSTKEALVGNTKPMEDCSGGILT